jgi:hypothetical protein
LQKYKNAWEKATPQYRGAFFIENRLANHSLQGDFWFYTEGSAFSSLFSKGTFICNSFSMKILKLGFWAYLSIKTLFSKNDFDIF